MDLSPRLSALVNNALKYPIAEIVAPAGFGKSTVIDATATAFNFSVARIRGEAEPTLSLMRALCGAIAAEAPDLQATLPNAYANAYSEGRLHDLVQWFLDSFAAVDVKIAVDDLHLLGEDATAWKILSDVVDRSSPQRGRWILTSRTRTRLPQVEWIARGYQAKPLTEKELAFEPDDILCVSHDIGLDLSPDRAARIRDITEGWPLMSVYALRLIAQGYDFSALEQVLTASGVDTVAERLLSQVTPEDVRLLLDVGLYDGATVDDLFALDPRAPQSLNRLAALGIPLIQASDGRWRLHDLIRNYMARRETALRQIEANRIAIQLESKGQLGDALRIAISGQASDAVKSLLERRVRYFSSAADPQLVREALLFLTARAQKPSWQIAIVQGCGELRAGNFEMSNHFFRSAAVLSHGTDRTYALSRLGYSLLFNGAMEAVEVFRKCDAGALPDDPAQACEILAVLAWGFIFTADLAGAERHIARAISLLPRVTDPVVQALVYTRAALVALSGSRLPQADEFAKIAIDIAERNRLFEILARAFNIRKLIAAPYQEAQSLAFAKQSAYFAAKMLDNVAIYLAETSIFSLLCRAGDIEEAKELRRRLFPIPDLLNEKLGSAMRMTAAHLAMLEKDYDGARGLLGNAGSVGDRFLESGIAVVREFAFQQYDALLCALLNDGESAVRSARKALAITSELRLTGAELSAIPELEIGKIICAAILGKNGQMFEAEKLLDDLSKNATELYRRDLAKWVSAALMVPSAEPSEEAETRANGFIILLRRAFESTQPIALTPAERRVLESLALGRASKEIAAITGRSVKTVDNQVASIMRKLSARSRGEAVARARRSGLLTDPAREASPV